MLGLQLLLEFWRENGVVLPESEGFPEVLVPKRLVGLVLLVRDGLEGVELSFLVLPQGRLQGVEASREGLEPASLGLDSGFVLEASRFVHDPLSPGNLDGVRV